MSRTIYDINIFGNRDPQSETGRDPNFLADPIKFLSTRVRDAYERGFNDVIIRNPGGVPLMSDGSRGQMPPYPWLMVTVNQMDAIHGAVKQAHDYGMRALLYVGWGYTPLGQPHDIQPYSCLTEVDRILYHPINLGFDGICCDAAASREAEDWVDIENLPYGVIADHFAGIGITLYAEAYRRKPVRNTITMWRHSDNNPWRKGLPAPSGVETIVMVTDADLIKGCDPLWLMEDLGYSILELGNEVTEVLTRKAVSL